MKDFFNCIIEWVSKCSLVEKFGANEFTRGLIVGIITGIVLLLVIRFILWLCFRRKSCSCIELKNPSGMITINSSAIASVLKTAVKPLESLTVSKVRLFKRKDQFDIYLRAALDPEKGTVPQLTDELAKIVREQMKNVFGVENIREVRLNVVSCRKNSAGIAGEDADADPAEKEDFSDGDSFTSTISIKPPMEK